MHKKILMLIIFIFTILYAEIKNNQIITSNKNIESNQTNLQESTESNNTFSIYKSSIDTNSTNFSYTSSIKIKNKQINKKETKTKVIEQNGTKFYIREDLLKYDDLIKMILKTESMDNDERQYWFDIMPSMTDKQIDRLYNILDTERKKLQALEIKYQEEIKALNEKHLLEWQAFQLKSKQDKELNSTTEQYYRKMLEKLQEIRKGQ